MELICNECNQYKPEADFYKNRTFKRGYDYKCKTCRQEYRQQHPRVITPKRRADKLESAKRYYAERPEHSIAKRSASGHRRRARKYGASGNWAPMQWLALKAQYDYRCLCCGKQEPEIKLTPDMVIPFATGGANEIENMQPLCLDCNNHKHLAIIDYRPKQS